MIVRPTTGLILLTLLAAPLGAQPLDAAALGRALDRALPTASAEAAREVYAARADSRLWTDRDGLSERGRQLVTALGQAGADGLDPAAYLSPVPSAPVAAEAGLTAAFLGFSEDLMHGRVDPASVHRDWRATRRRLDASAALRLAAWRGPEAAIRAARPPHAGYARLRDALADLRARPAPTPLPDGPILRLGDQGPAVAALRRRLADDSALSASGDTFDAALETAVRRAQSRLGLAIDGAVGPATRAALNAGPAETIRRVVLNLERWRWLPADLGARHLVVDVAGMQAALVDGDRAVWQSRAIVGTPRTPTPGLSSLVEHVVLAPYWVVPESIARAEIRPRLARDPGYLARHHMDRLPGGTIRQRPGPDNPLGPAKLIFANPFGVRVHGTSAPSLFEARVRAFSHGCIRVERPLALAAQLLPGMSPDEIAATAATDTDVWIALDAPVPIHVVYWTARVDADGMLLLRPDVYGRDRALARALGLRAPS
ncbi:L,D-transpeptidase family protein [Rubrivirga sp. IMCC43871]|uniref:L,D-transpeptidase family protein n=1 Tax=Rubrivirga sp. IMCC43871 TaxID=3391575 RepID=UPI00398FC273